MQVKLVDLGSARHNNEGIAYAQAESFVFMPESCLDHVCLTKALL